MKKVCNKCGEEKDLCEFGKSSGLKSGVSNSCKLCGRVRGQRYREQNPEQRKISVKDYKDNNREIFKKNRIKSFSKRYQSDPIYRLKKNIVEKTVRYLRHKQSSGSKLSMFNSIGCSPSQLREYIENRFTDGMSWDNHGLYGWHLDHIIPISSAKTEEELYMLSHYTNLQPLWAEDNMIKGNSNGL
jgi:hypothetical protein